MHAIYTVAAIAEALQVLKARVPPEQWSETPLPVIAAPGWWMRQIAEQFGAGADELPTMIHDCPVVQQDELAGPVLVDHDGAIYRVDPDLPGQHQAPAATQ